MFAGTPQHPVAQALRRSSRDFALPEEHLQTVIDGMEMDLDQHRYLDFDELELYCHRVAGVVGLLSAEIFGYTNPATREYARDLGIAFQLTNIIRDVGEDARRGRIYLPQDELARFGVPHRRSCAREGGDGFRALMADPGRARARAWYERALDAACRPRTARRSARASSWRRSTATLLDEIERDGYAVLDQRIALTPLRKLWIAWRTSRRS